MSFKVDYPKEKYYRSRINVHYGFISDKFIKNGAMD